jgi:hypothetical protein
VLLDIGEKVKVWFKLVSHLINMVWLTRMRSKNLIKTLFGRRKLNYV